MQKLHRLGQNSQSNRHRLWTKVHQILQAYRRPFIVKNLFFFRSSVPRFFWRYFSLTREVVQKSLKRRQFWAPRFWEKTCKFWTTVFKPGLLSNMWQNVIGSLVWPPRKAFEKKQRTRAKYNGLLCIRVGGHNNRSRQLCTVKTRIL